MEIFKQIAPLKAFLRDIRQKGKSVGLVPTMGALHQGHLKLIAASKASNDITICTIYVNPTQFNNPEDLQKYPRTIERDIQMLQQVHCDVLFSPNDEELYPSKAAISLSFGHLDHVMEGKFRPGHFSGVGLVVSKFFNIVRPNNAYFGQKDWQQFAVIRTLINDLKFDVKLHSVDTHRESDGLAQSSRNMRLNREERKNATIFYKSLMQARKSLQNGVPIQDVRQQVHTMIESTPEVTLEYFEVADSKNLNILENVSEADQPIMCIAGYVGNVRLIDNMFVFDSPGVEGDLLVNT
jgi:pantoate--beta-alanine ligase